MKYFWVTALCFLSFAATGQQVSPMFYKEILLTPKRYTLQALTEEMQAQSGISFSYNAESIDPATKIKIKSDRITVAELLALIKKKTGISYKIISKTHIIYQAPATRKKKAAKKGKAKHAPTASEKTNTTVVLSATDEAADRTDIPGQAAATNILNDSAGNIAGLAGDSTPVVHYNSGGGGGGGGGSSDEEERQLRPSHIPERKWRRGTASSGDNNILQFFGNNLLMAAGASVDETFYFNPTVKLGFKFLYGIASYNLGGGAATWRYGLGGSAAVDEHWSLHAVITTGQSVSKDYGIPAADTSIPDIPLTATSKLTRYGISIHYNFGGGLAIEAGTTFNSLKTNYTSNGHPVTLSDILPIGYDADKKYPGIKPPYTLGNSYTGNSTGNTKTWLGIQLTLLYQFQFSEP